jgi:hypothetical protein
MARVGQVRADAGHAPVSAKLRALLSIASAVQVGGSASLHGTWSKPAWPAPRRGDPRHSSDRGRVLHVQQVRRWVGYDRPVRSRCLRRRGTAPGHGGLPGAVGSAQAPGLIAGAGPDGSAHAIIDTPTQSARSLDRADGGRSRRPGLALHKTYGPGGLPTRPCSGFPTVRRGLDNRAPSRLIAPAEASAAQHGRTDLVILVFVRR